MGEHSLRHVINVIATFTFLIPITAGVLKFKFASNHIRLLFYLLVYGFITDLVVWQLLDISRSTSLLLFNMYGLVESTILFLFIRMTSESEVVKKICILLIALAIPSWFIIYFSYQDEQPHMATFDTSYNIAVAFLTGFALLKLGEKEISLKTLPMFWMFLGLFVFSFCTFFISSLLETELRQKIWFIHNLIAFISYLIFAKGFLTIKPADPPSPSSE